MPTLVFMKLFEDASQTLIAKLWHHLLQQLSKLQMKYLLAYGIASSLPITKC